MKAIPAVRYAIRKNKKRKKPTETVGFLSCVGIALSSRGVTTKVFSALMSLTAVFGMGKGVPSSPKTPTVNEHYDIIPARRCQELF